MTKNVSDAEDMMQDAFIQIFRGLGSFRGDSAFSTWIYRVVVNTGFIQDLAALSRAETASTSSWLTGVSQSQGSRPSLKFLHSSSQP